MVIVDTHCHASPYYFEPVEVLLFQMNAAGVEKATLVQHKDNANNWYLIECARRYPGRFKVIGRVDVEQADAGSLLEGWAAEGLAGVRLRSTTRSPGEDPLAIWRKASELGLVVSCSGNEAGWASPEFRSVIEQLPNLPIVIEHLGHPARDEEPPYALYRKILALAEYPNVYIKVGGLGEICVGPNGNRPVAYDKPMQFERIPPFVSMAYEVFGARRMMWGSDFPPSASREGYANTLRFLLEHMSFCSQEDKEWIFGKTALLLFRFAESPVHPGG